VSEKIRPSVTAPPSRKWRRLRFVALGIAAVALVLGLWGGLARLGLALPGGAPGAPGAPALAELHAALMISGFLGTLISLERAVAIGRWWACAAPAVSAVGALFLLFLLFLRLPGAPLLAACAFLLAGLALTYDSAAIAVRQPALFTVVLAVAAACWAAGTIAWIIGRSAAEITGWWLAFLILTVAAERLELSKLLSPPPVSQAMFAVAALLIIIGAARGEFAGEAAPFSGIGLLASTLWLIKHDVAPRTVRQSGQTRFSAACMLTGYFWLGVAGLLVLLAPPGTMAFSYDAAVHAVTIGFIFSMIFGHAPVILPAVTGLRVTYSAFAYAPLALLHLSVLLRIAADVFEWIDLRTASGPLTVIALAGYAGTLIAASRMKRRPGRSPTPF
jgi:hypothetical protein